MLPITHALVLACVVAAADGGLISMARNMTDASCIARRVPCSTLATSKQFWDRVFLK